MNEANKFLLFIFIFWVLRKEASAEFSFVQLAWQRSPDPFGRPNRKGGVIRG
jgi:hypothetical protein